MAAYGLFRYLRQRPSVRLAAKALRLWRDAGVGGLRWRLRLLRQQTHAYARWLQAQEAAEPAARAALAAEIAALRRPPLISVLMPVCDAPERWLRRAIDSVRGQLYPHWQLCIADDASRAAHVRPLLEAAAAADPRIRLLFRETRGHICLATRTAQALAEGDFITFLDHDDELAPLALARVAAEIGRHPEADLLYSDEDLIGTDGRRYDPYFKPDWNPELLRAQNYLCHLSVIRADLLRDLDAFRPEVQGSQDWDLVLRASERARCIRHLPHILYHWRSVPGSTARSDTAKRYALEAGRCAVQAHLARCGESGAAELLAFGHLRVRSAVPEPAPLVSLIVCAHSAAAVARRLPALLRRTRYPRIELLLAVAQPGDATRLPDGARLIVGDDPTQRLNRAAASASGEILCFVDGGGEARDDGWLETLVAVAARADVGAVGARLLLPDDSVWHAGYLLDPQSIVRHPYRGAPAGFAGVRNRALLQQNVAAVSAACFAVRRAAFVQAGAFAPASGGFRDVDVCLRLLDAGLRNVWTPHVSLTLHASSAHDAEDAGDRALAQAARYMRTRWGERLARDPAGHPCLVLEHGLPVAGVKRP